MTVQELIKALQAIQHKDLPVHFYSGADGDNAMIDVPITEVLVSNDQGTLYVELS